MDVISVMSFTSFEPLMSFADLFPILRAIHEVVELLAEFVCVPDNISPLDISTHFANVM